MSLERKAIRRAAVCALKGRTYAGERVYDSSRDPFRPTVDGPVCLFVYTLSDTPEPVGAGTTNSGRIYARDLELAVEVFVEEDVDTPTLRREDLLDDVTGQIERVLSELIPRLHRVQVADLDGNSEALDINPSKSRLERVEIALDAQGRALVGAARVLYLVHYGTVEKPGSCGDLVELDGLRVVWDFPPPDGAWEAQDEITQPTE